MYTKERAWSLDICEFERWRERLQLTKTPYVREIVIKRMHQIRARWPHLIKKNEIPED